MENDFLPQEAGVIENELALHGTYASTTRGISMRPLFKTGRDMIVIKSISSPLKKYDVVVYTGVSNKYTMHRIIAVKDDHYVIRGDNTYKKEYVKKDRVIGILTEFNRKGKHHSVDEMGYRIYSRIWNFIYPVRHFFHICRRMLSRIYHKIFG